MKVIKVINADNGWDNVVALVEYTDELYEACLTRFKRGSYVVTTDYVVSNLDDWED